MSKALRDVRERTELLCDPVFGLGVLLSVALLAGGGGVNAAFGNLAVQLTAVALGAIHRPVLAGFVFREPGLLRMLVVSSLLLPLLQLVPLPPQAWQVLPGRELVTQSFALINVTPWSPLSLDRGRTLGSFLGCLAPFSIIAIGSSLDAASLLRLQRFTVAVGFLVAIFGALHLVNPNWGDLYADQRPLPGVLVGTFADRNGAALFLGGCLLLLIGLPRPNSNHHQRRALALRTAGGAFLALCVLLTQSRTGMVFLAAPAALLIWRVGVMATHTRGSPGLPHSRALMIAACAGAAAVALTSAVFMSGRVQLSLDRFDDSDGMRTEMREDALYAAHRYWPAGAGMGTFDEVFQIDESLEYVSPRRAGRVHMDYLELSIEAGLPGIALAAGWLAWLVLAGWRAMRRPYAWPARAAALFLAGVAAQSLLSFPLRSQAMLCAAALAIVLAACSPVAVPRAEACS